MANYCALSDIQAKVQSTTFSDGPSPAATQPTATQVTDFCLQITADMDQKFLGYGISLPIDASKADYLRRIATFGVLAEVYDAMDTEPKKAERFSLKYEKEMEFIRDNHHMLEVTGATPAPPEGTSPDRDSVPFPEGEDSW